MTQTQLAQKLGISGGYLWKLYHGYADPSPRMADKLEKHIGKGRVWWTKSNTQQRQRVFDKMMEAA